jgi:hypothetical protein
MNYLQISDPPLCAAVAEYAQQQGGDWQITPDAAPLCLVVAEGQAQLLADGRAVEAYALPLRLAALWHDLEWVTARRREAATREITLADGPDGPDGPDSIVLWPHDFALRWQGGEVQLTGREVALLQYLSQCGEATKEKLLQDVWQYHPDTDTHTVETHLWRLRQKIQQAGLATPLIITTETGYRLS